MDIKRLLFIFDNAPYHISDTTSDFIKGSGITALTLPTYHPEFNPVELGINFLKSKVFARVREGR